MKLNVEIFFAHHTTAFCFLFFQSCRFDFFFLTDVVSFIFDFLIAHLSSDFLVVCQCAHGTEERTSRCQNQGNHQHCQQNDNAAQCIQQSKEAATKKAADQTAVCQRTVVKKFHSFFPKTKIPGNIQRMEQIRRRRHCQQEQGAAKGTHQRPFPLF